MGIHPAPNVPKVWISKGNIIPIVFAFIFDHLFDGPGKSEMVEYFQCFPCWSNRQPLLLAHSARNTCIAIQYSHFNTNREQSGSDKLKSYTNNPNHNTNRNSAIKYRFESNRIRSNSKMDRAQQKRIESRIESIQIVVWTTGSSHGTWNGALPH